MNKRGFDPTILIPNAVLFIAVSFGVITSREPLRSIRPASSGEYQEIVASDATPARPWEDPLTVHRRGGTQPVPSKTAGAIELDQLLSEFKNSKNKEEPFAKLLEKVDPNSRTEKAPGGPSPTDATAPEENKSSLDVPAASGKNQDASVNTKEGVFKEAATASEGNLSRLVENIHEKTKNDEDGNKKETAKDLLKLINKIVDQPELLLVVLVPDGFESDAIEKRIRIRQAIMAAMTRAQYLPDHSHEMKHQVVTFGVSTKVKLVSDDFIPENLVARFDGFAHGSLPITASTKEETNQQHRAVMGDLRRWDERVRVVYVNMKDLERALPRKKWDHYEADRSLKQSSDAQKAWDSDPFAMTEGLLKTAMAERNNRRNYVAGLPHSVYSGYLWSTTIRRLQEAIKEYGGNPRIDVIGPDTSDGLMDLLIMRSPVGGRNEPLRVLSPFASIETDLLIHKLMGKVANPNTSTFGGERKKAVDEKQIEEKPEEYAKPWFTRRQANEKSKELNQTTLKTEAKGEGDNLHFIHNPTMVEDGTNMPVKDAADPGHTEIIQMTLGDDLLARTLVRELANRNVNFTNPAKSIVLISESDTIYGNAFPASFRKQALKYIGALNTNNIMDADKARKAIQIQRFSYLRGLDGVTALAPKAQQAAKQEKEDSKYSGVSDLTKAIGLPAIAVEKGDPGWRPEGTQQYDRVRALASTLMKQFASQKGEVVAVGVVGSDPYDKMVIFQALRPLLPGVIFFTPDLESNYLSDENLPYTRNLLVSSTYGLRLNQKIHGSTMPFRDSYQTAVYHSVLTSLCAYRPLSQSYKEFESLSGTEASFWQRFRFPFWTPGHREVKATTILSKLDHRDNPLISVAASHWQPNLYEIGTRGAIPLAQSSEYQIEHANTELLPEIDHSLLLVGFFLLSLIYFVVVLVSCKTRNPKNRSSNSDSEALPLSRTSRRLWIVTIICIASLSVSLLHSKPLVVAFFLSSVGIVCFGAIYLGWRRGSYWILISSACIGMLVLGWIISYYHNKPDQEPFGLWDGVSAWPSEVLRFIGLALGGYYCILASGDSRSALRNARRIMSPVLSLAERRKTFASKAPKPDPGGFVKTKMIVELDHAIRVGENPHDLVVTSGEEGQSLIKRIIECIRTEIFEGERKDNQHPLFQGCLNHPGWLLAVTLILISCGALIFYMMGGPPPKPVRGDVAKYVDNFVLFGNLSLLYILTAFAVIHNLFCLNSLILPTERGLDRQEISDAASAEIPLRLVEDFTVRTSRLPLFPCLIIFILIFSRSSALDNWTMPPQIVSVVLFVVGVLVVFDSMVSYRARRLKSKIQNILNLEKSKQRVNNPEPSDSIDTVSSGVFASFFSNPVFRAVMIPITGGGLLSLIELLS